MFLLKPTAALTAAIFCASTCWAALPENDSYQTKAAEVTAHIQKNFWLKKRDLYAIEAGSREPDHLWGAGVMFSALVGAARHDPHYKPILRKFFQGLDAYWDDKVKIPGYEPSPTAGNGNDKYYDDNAWMVITYLEAYELTGESRYLKRATETLDFVMSGWDDKAGGGIWWHERHLEGSKNTCANAPAAVGCFRVSKFLPAPAAKERIAEGGKIVRWTTEKLRAGNGLFADNIKVATGKINGGQLTYNSALMLRSFRCLFSLTGRDVYLNEAVKMGKAADGLLSSKTGAYRDSIKWSHLMVEADLELDRKTKDKTLFQRAKTNCDVHYAAWKAESFRSLIDSASLARELWLMADTETAAGRKFWESSDRLIAKRPSE